MNLRFLSLFFFCFVHATTFADPNSEKIYQLDEGSVGFFALGKPSMLKIHGETKGFTGKLTIKNENFTGEFIVQLDGFETGMKLRDQHLKEKVFETKQFQNAILKIEKLKVPGGVTGKFSDLDFSGKLNLHGVENPVSGKVNLDLGPSLKFEAKLEIKITEFKMTPPEFMGINILDQVRVEAHGSAK